jgi:hypothetical protein
VKRAKSGTADGDLGRGAKVEGFHADEGRADMLVTRTERLEESNVRSVSVVQLPVFFAL